MTAHRTLSSSDAPAPWPWRQTAVVAVGLLLLEVVATSFLLWTAPGSSPHGIRVAVVSTDLQAGQRAADRLRASAAGLLAPFAVVDVVHARRALQDRSADAAFLSGPKTTDELIVASAGGPGQSALLAARFQAYDKTQQRTLKLAEAAPLPAGDRHGTAPQYLALIMLLGGSLGAVLLASQQRLAAGRVRTVGRALALHAAYALASALVVVLVTRASFGLFRGHEVQTVLAGALICLTAARTFAAAQAVAGRLAAGLLMLGLVVAGDLAARTVVPYAFQPGVLRNVGPYLFGGASVDLLRDAAYFHGHGTAQPLLVLAVWLAAGLVTTCVVQAGAAPVGRSPQLPERSRTRPLVPAGMQRG